MTKAYLYIDPDNGHHIDAKGTEFNKPEIHKASNDITDPAARLALNILNAAKHEAAQGDVSALIFLIVDGTTLERLIMPPTPNASPFHDTKHVDDGIILTFCNKIWQQIESGDLAPRWQDSECDKRWKKLLLNKLKMGVQLDIEHNQTSEVNTDD